MAPSIYAMDAHDLADLLRAVAALLRAILWPLVVLVVLMAYKTELVELLKRLRRAKLPGGANLEFDKALSELDATASEADRSVSDQPPASPDQRVTVEGIPSQEAVGGLEEHVLEQAAKSPKVALILLSTLLEREIRELLAGAGMSAEPSPLRDVRRLAVSATVVRAVEEFRDVSNRIVHGIEVDDDQAVRAIDSGLRILETLRRIPRARHFVRHTGLTLFADFDGVRRREDVEGVMIQSSSADGREQQPAVYPTTREYHVGAQVSWEWNTDHSWPESWYQDADTGNIEYAFFGAAEFVGREFSNR